MPPTLIIAVGVKTIPKRNRGAFSWKNPLCVDDGIKLMVLNLLSRSRPRLFGNPATGSGPIYIYIYIYIYIECGPARGVANRSGGVTGVPLSEQAASIRQPHISRGLRGLFLLDFFVTDCQIGRVCEGGHRVMEFCLTIIPG